ncbi:MAG TPA: hypothetical protein VF525_08325 [Pyrinomonadaceae bacterium]|jgi:hypothetical protein
MKDETTQERAPAQGDAASGTEPPRPEPETDVEAEQESAAAMDADVPQPPDESGAG